MEQKTEIDMIKAQKFKIVTEKHVFGNSKNNHKHATNNKL